MPRKTAGSSSAANAPKASSGPAEGEEQQICYLDNFLQGARRDAQLFFRSNRTCRDCTRPLTSVNHAQFMHAVRSRH